MKSKPRFLGILLSMGTLGWVLTSALGQSGTTGGSYGTIVVKVPADATVTIGGQATKQMGMSRTYYTPDLVPGFKYQYEFVVVSPKGGKHSQWVEVTGGKTVTVDLSGPGDGPKDGDKKDDAKKDKKGAKDGFDTAKLIGKWIYVKGEKAGEAIPAENLKKQMATIDKENFTLTGDDLFIMKYEIDAKKTPAQIRFTITKSPFGPGAKAGGVIEFKGEELHLCYGSDGETTPTKFETKGTKAHYFVLKRAK